MPLLGIPLSCWLTSMLMLAAIVRPGGAWSEEPVRLEWSVAKLSGSDQCSSHSRGLPSPLQSVKRHSVSSVVFHSISWIKQLPNNSQAASDGCVQNKDKEEKEEPKN